ncbi:glycosyltransferase [Calothrix sp. PCC 6303]|uniref:glycosyltransferase n=1 Tax=Calothrix sp. PCC 6303 TaxID=1170562 RepID=UPI0002A026AF|nr:glycosyltransferase family 2 protein [Calothrix sp. PCC 6303]AFZ00950.1 glycosyl transferase family 2 [Calothrix sp. PCC 6303]
MPANSWPENDSYNEFEPLDSLLSELVADDEFLEETSPSVSLPSRFKNRRPKAALLLAMVWICTITLHLVSWGSLLVIAMALVIGFQAMSLVFAESKQVPQISQDYFPLVSILVAAKNEEIVISNLVKNLCNLDYPRGRYEVWIVDDNSTDRTPEILAGLSKEYCQLRVFQRSPDATGGKSGALNQVLSLSKGEIIAVFDADAQVPHDLLTQVVPLFAKERVGAVQVRKAIANTETNFWTKGQAAEMALDTYLQCQRGAIAGTPELRGNGQFVRRKALRSCGGWNEETITDDLDLSFRLHIDKWDIECVFQPAVEEEGVTSAIALWHQRNRWVEGGYQRYIDYWDLLLRNRMGTRKSWDMLIFLLIQYLVPTAALPDFLMALIRHRPPILAPLTSVAISVSMTGMFIGLKRARQDKDSTLSSYLEILLQTLRGTIYMAHWLVVIASVTIRMSVRPKRFRWIKTVHKGLEAGN